MINVRWCVSSVQSAKLARITDYQNLISNVHQDFYALLVALRHQMRDKRVQVEAIVS